MSLQVEKLEKNMAKLTIEVPMDEFEKAVQSAYLKQRGSVNVPGFRKGKVPRQMIEKMYGPEIFYEEAANIIIPTAYETAYDECDLEIVSQPDIKVTQIEKGKPFVFTAEVATKPEVTLGKYIGVEVDKGDVEVTEDEVESRLDQEVKKNARSISVTDRSIQDGDEVVLDYEGFVDEVPFDGGKGEKHNLVIGSGSFIPGFEEQLIGKEVLADTEVNVTFPTEYHSEELAGKEAVFKCFVHEIKAKEYPELNDEFADEVSEFETLDEYKDSIRKELKEQKEETYKNVKEGQAIDKIIEDAQMDIPEPMVDLQVGQMADDFARRISQQGLTVEQYFQFTGMTKEKLFEELRPQALKRIQSKLVLEAIAEKEAIEISDEQVEEELKKMSEQYKMELDEVKGFMGDDAIKQMKKDLSVQKAAEMVAEKAIEVEPKVEEKTEEAEDTAEE